MTTSSDSMPNAASILAGFPVPTLSIVATAGESAPTFETLFILQRELNNNSISIASERGDGRSGHLVLASPPALFAARPGYVRFVEPINPGRNPTFPCNATDECIRALTLEHSNNYKVYLLYRNTEAALKQQLLQACPALYLKPLQHPTEGFANATTLQLLTHLFSTYGSIDPDKVFERNHKLGQPWWHPPKPVETLFEEIEKAKTFIIVAGSTIDDTMFIQAVYINFNHTGLFMQECSDWFNKPAADKTWEAARAFFTKADKNRSKLTTADTGFGSANATTTVPTTTKKRMADDSTTNSANANAEVATLTKKLRSSNHGNRAASTTSTPPTKTTTINSASTNKMEPYCHSHGYTKHWHHNSLTCRNHNDNHNEGNIATLPLIAGIVPRLLNDKEGRQETWKAFA